MSIIILRGARWFLKKNIISTGDIVAVQVAGIVPIQRAEEEIRN